MVGEEATVSHRRQEMKSEVRPSTQPPDPDLRFAKICHVQRSVIQTFESYHTDIHIFPARLDDCNMPAPPADTAQLTADDFELTDEENDTSLPSPGPSRPPMQPQPSRSSYHLPASEQLRGVANRIIFSRYYILFYFVMMSLSLTTVILSLIATREFVIQLAVERGSRLMKTDEHRCPPIAWHILEIIVNVMMVVEVSTRWVAYGKVSLIIPIRKRCSDHRLLTSLCPLALPHTQLVEPQKYPMTPLNIIDLLLVLFCTVTLILVFRNPCSTGTRRELSYRRAPNLSPSFRRSQSNS